MKSLKNLLYEANKDPMMNLSGKNKPFTNKKLNEFLKRSKPIKSKGKTIGFYMTGKSISGDPKIDNIFITKSERQKGNAYKVSKRFLKNNPGLVWISDERNTASIATAKKLGLTLQEERS